LIAVTAHISTDVAAAPFLWVVPLGLFLLTFVLVFQPRPVIKAHWMGHAQLALMLGLVATIIGHNFIGWPVALAIHLGLFFATAMVAHGQLSDSRPEPAQLTSYFMWISAGGVLGGLFSGLLAPVIFNSIAEYYLLLFLGLLCRPGFIPATMSQRTRIIVSGVAVVAFGALVVHEQTRTDSIRSFFGVNKILEQQEGRFRVLAHGTRVHGVQRLLDDAGNAVTGQPEPLSYYYFGGPISDGIEAARAKGGGQVGRVAAVGLGSGSLACHVRAGEDWRFYEIDPVVISIARDRSQFRFLSDCAPQVPVIVGDGRLTLVDEPNASFNLIVIDAFSSDSIPIHLLTVEALELYKRKLAPGGSIVMHISNRNLELESVAVATATKAGLVSMARMSKVDPELMKDYKAGSHVVIMARALEDMASLAQNPEWRNVIADPKRAPWTDDYADVISAIIRSALK
jgi:hypothetical protein